MHRPSAPQEWAAHMDPCKQSKRSRSAFGHAYCGIKVGGTGHALANVCQRLGQTLDPPLLARPVPAECAPVLPSTAPRHSPQGEAWASFLRPHITEQLLAMPASTNTNKSTSKT